MVDLPDTMVDLPDTMVDLPDIMADLPETMNNLSKIIQNLYQYSKSWVKSIIIGIFYRNATFASYWCNLGILLFYAFKL